MLETVSKLLSQQAEDVELAAFVDQKLWRKGVLRYLSVRQVRPKTGSSKESVAYFGYSGDIHKGGCEFYNYRCWCPAIWTQYLIASKNHRHSRSHPFPGPSKEIILKDQCIYRETSFASNSKET